MWPRSNKTAGTKPSFTGNTCSEKQGKQQRGSPAGKVRFESKVYDVVSDGDMIAASTQVKVVEVTGNRIVVTEV